MAQAQNPDRFVPVEVGDDPKKTDWSLGNPLTFNDSNGQRLDLELNIVVSIILSLAMQQREHEAAKAAAQPVTPSPVALAA